MPQESGEEQEADPVVAKADLRPLPPRPPTVWLSAICVTPPPSEDNWNHERAEGTESTTGKEELPDLMLAVTPEFASSLYILR